MVTKTETRTDQGIQQDVMDELSYDARLQPNEIGVAVKNGIVTLAGFVDSYARKWAAEEAALRVRGVRAVTNEIEVKLPIEDERTDPEIAAAALHALEDDAGIPPDAVKVAVSKGWVTLTGEVAWHYQKTDAERAVRHLRGVRGVTNTIKVKPNVQISPEELKRRIDKAILRNARTDAERIHVDVQGSKVILRGAVRSWAEIRDATRAAWSAPGVTDVENEIRLLV
jgi:osmotically-inducible protein OsmY